MTNNHDDRVEYIQRFDRIIEANYPDTDHD